MADKDEKLPEYQYQSPPAGPGSIYPEQARKFARTQTENWDYGPPYYQPGWRGGLQKPSGPNPKTYSRGGKVKAGSSTQHMCKGGKVLSSKVF